MFSVEGKREKGKRECRNIKLVRTGRFKEREEGRQRVFESAVQTTCGEEESE
jgi:hypothetical protein